MKKLIPALCVASLGLLAGAGDKPKPDDVKAKLKGTWEPVSVESEGQKFPQEKLKGQRMTFEGDKVSYTLGGDAAEQGTFTVDPAKNPPELDITPPDGSGRGQMKMIYHLDGDTLKLAGHKDDKQRPKSFEDKDAIVITLKRVKK